MSQAGEGSRKPETAKRAGLGREAVIAAAHRSPRRSSLFWWLFDHYDELIEAKGLSALGLPWKSICAVFSELELSLVGGAPITAERASKTWQRVRKEKARLAALEAKAEAERSSAEYALALHRIVHRAVVGSSTASGRCAPAASAAAYCGGGRERVDRHAWRTGADRGA